MEVGLVRQRDINQEIQESYLDYAMSVIVARALPDARDGLKPVHRRILYAMHDMGIRPGTPYKKSARIVGEVLGKYHPHGDSAVYEAMVRMAQDFSMRYELVDGQGNFGSIDGDSAAAMRYTEARMASLGSELLIDIEKDTVEWTDNFDGTLLEPDVLPSAIPNLLVNGASGIAVGMSTSIPPHNLGEVCDALVFMLNNWDALDDIGVPELMQFIKGPDFPTGGVVYTMENGGTGEDQLRSAYATGRGKLKIRAKAHIEDLGRGRNRIIISEIPFQTNKTSLIERIAELTRDGRIEGISNLRDESDRTGLRIVIDISRAADAVEVLASLFKYTPLETTFSMITLALVDNEPHMLSLKQALKVYLEHRLEVVKRRSEFDLRRAKERAHILEGLLIALGNLDAVIDTIRRSRTVDSAHNNLRKQFKLSDAQAEAILQMQLRRLAALERNKLEDEYKEKRALIQMLEALLKSSQMMRMEVARELSEIREKYNDQRRTVIISGPAGNIQAGDFLGPREDTWVTLTESGLLSRTYTDTPLKVTTEVSDPPLAMMASNTTHTLYLFTENGIGATTPVKVLQQQDNPENGLHFTTVSPLAREDVISWVLSLPPELETGYVVALTAGGEVKRLRLEDLPGLTANVFKFMDLEKDDKLIWLGHVTDDNEVLLVTLRGQAIRFKVSEVRPTGLGAGGMRAIKLADQKDRVIGAGVVDVGAVVWTCTDTGVAKTSLIEEYPVQGRAGSGVITMKLPTDAAGIAVATVGRLDDQIVVVMDRDVCKQISIGDAPQAKRAGKGDYIKLPAKHVVKRLVKLRGRVDLPEQSAPAISMDLDAMPDISPNGSSDGHLPEE